MKFHKRWLFIVSVFLIVNNVSSQEYLIGLDLNPVVKKHAENYQSPVKQKSEKSLELPFFDDFFEQTIYPNDTLWSNRYVYINNSFGQNPPTLGVATFDAVNDSGAIYSTATYSGIFAADTLTSNPINLNYKPGDSIYLSFFYQPQGNGEFPETNDSLVVHFYASGTQKWKSVKKITGSTVYPFRAAIIPIIDTSYLKDGFRFRFINYVTLSGKPNQGSRIANCDHWNIDYVKLDKNRTFDDTIMNDVAFTQNIETLLNGYTSIPWEHVKRAGTIPMNDNFSISIKNNYNKKTQITGLTPYCIENEKSVISIGDLNLAANELKTINPSHIFTYPIEVFESKNTATFQIKSFYTTDTDEPTHNDKVVFRQTFDDYYAHDDGSAEFGYGIRGSGSKNASIAYRFETLVEGELSSVDMYFNQTYKDASQKYFYLKIWEDDNGSPGNELFSQIGLRPIYEKDLNQFHNYPLLDEFEEPTSIQLPKIFYIGWQQTTDDLLNIGYDIDTDDENLFYNVDGQWRESSLKKALMIRPVFGGRAITTISSPKNNLIDNITIYPNPAKNQLKIKSLSPIKQITISDVSGRLLIINQNTDNQINISNLRSGIYFVKIQTSDKIITKKLLVK